MRKLRNLLSLLLILTLLLSTGSKLLANEQADIWINERGNVELLPNAYLALVNHGKEAAEDRDVYKEALYTERIAHDNERSAWIDERNAQDNYIKNLEKQADALNATVNGLNRKVDMLSFINGVYKTGGLIIISYVVVDALIE